MGWGKLCIQLLSKIRCWFWLAPFCAIWRKKGLRKKSPPSLPFLFSPTEPRPLLPSFLPPPRSDFSQQGLLTSKRKKEGEEEEEKAKSLTSSPFFPLVPAPLSLTLITRRKWTLSSSSSPSSSSFGLPPTSPSSLANRSECTTYNFLSSLKV